jgi:peptide/nickel transport system substrate-binding protein
MTDGQHENKGGSAMRFLHTIGYVAAAAITLAAGAGHAAAPQPDRSIRIVLDAEPDTLDPCNTTRSTIGFVIRNNLVETATKIDQATGHLQPGLVTEWARTGDNQWRLKLRSGVSFQDGTKFNAETFVKSFQRVLNPKLNCATRSYHFEGMKFTFDVIDDLTVNVNTDHPAPLMPTMLAMLPMVSPNTPFDDFTRAPVGTGPYSFAAWTPGQGIELKRNDTYWGPKPEVEAVTYLFRKESLVRAAMVASGEADIAPEIAPQDADNPAMDFSYLNSETMRLRIDLDKPPMNDLRVREAMNMALDRQSMIGSIYSPRWVLAKNYVMPTINGYNDSIQPYAYDPDKATKLIAEAKADGVPVDKEILVIARPNVPAGAEGMQAISEMLNAVGLNTRPQLLEANEYNGFYFKPFNDSTPPHLLMDIHDNNTGDAGITLLNKYHSSGGTSKTHDPELDKLIDEGSAAENPKRQELYQEAFARIHDQAYDIMLFHQVADARVSPRLKFKPTSRGLLDVATITFK